MPRRWPRGLGQRFGTIGLDLPGREGPRVDSRSALRTALLVGAAAALVAAAMSVQEKRTLAEETADDTEARLAALGPATRAVVVVRLGRDATEKVRAHRG